MSNVVNFDLNPKRIKSIFNKDTLSRAIDTGIGNLEKTTPDLIIAIKEINDFLDNKFFQAYYNELISSLDYSHCVTTERDGVTEILYKLLIPVRISNANKLLTYHLETILLYIYSKIHNDRHTRVINKILKVFNMDVISHSVVSDVESKIFIIEAMVTLNAGSLYDTLVKIRAEILNTTEEDEDNDADNQYDSDN